MKLSWLKMDIGILDDQKIKVIRKMPAGSDLFVVWIGLLCLGMRGKTPGVIELDEGIPYSSEDLANHLDLSQKTVQMALSAFARLKMVEISTGGTIEIINFRKHQSLERIEQQRERNRLNVQKHRERQAMLRIGNSHVTDYTITCNPLELEKKEKEKEKKIKKKKDKDGEAPAATPPMVQPSESSPKENPPTESPLDPKHPLVPADPVPESDGSRLWQAVYEKDKSLGLLPLDSDTAGKVIYFKQGKQKAESIVKEDGLEAAFAVFKFAYGNKFCQPVRIGNYKTYKARYMAEHGGTGETRQERNARLVADRQKRREARGEK